MARSQLIHVDRNQTTAISSRIGMAAAGGLDVSEPPDPLPAPTALLPGATANARVSRPSRLIFRLPDGVDSVPLSPEDLLGWEKSSLCSRLLQRSGVAMRMV
jgi:hypothetical protein